MLRTRSERADTPPLQSAHLGIELAGQLVLEVQDFFEMAPTEVLCQNRHLSLLRSGLDESDHVEKVLAAEAGAIFSRQLSRQRRDNLITVFRPRIAEDIAPYPAPNLPVAHHEFRVDGSRHLKPSCIDQATQVGGQVTENARRG